MVFNRVHDFARGVCLVLASVVATPAQSQQPASRQSPTPAIAHDTKPKPFVRVTISKETTYITEPLREDGYPDYLRYLNEKMSIGVTPHNNAIVPLAKVLGFSELEGETRKEYFKLLGIEPLPEKGDYFEPWSAYASRIPEAEQSPVPKGDKRTQKEYFEQLVEIGASRPWTGDEFPILAKWLQANQKHLDNVVAASHATHAYSPLLYDSDSSNPQTLICVLVPTINPIRDATRALRCRAMFRATTAETEAAIADLLACRRLASFVSSCPVLINFIFATNIENEACNSAVQLVTHTASSPKQVQDFHRQWGALPPIPHVANYFDVGERFMHLDVVCYLAREGWHNFTDILAMISEMESDEPTEQHHKKAMHPIVGAFFTPLVRWDEPLKDGNEWHDRLVRIAQLEDREQQAAELNTFDQDLHQIRDQVRTMPTRTGLWFYPRKIPTQVTSRALVGIMLSALEAAIGVAHRNETHRSLFEIGLALAEYRIDHKAYPDKLEELVPKYLSNVPVDDFGHRPLIYRKTDDGYLVYSMGENGKDDGGKTYEDEEDADDVSIGVQAPTQ